jgi:hypothetical protein
VPRARHGQRNLTLAKETRYKPTCPLQAKGELFDNRNEYTRGWDCVPLPMLGCHWVTLGEIGCT